MSSNAANKTSSSAASARGLRSRRLRVTTGCLTCRQRHVKCDEKKPKCVNCGKKNRTCRWENHRSCATASSKESTISLDTVDSQPALPIEENAVAAVVEDIDEDLADSALYDHHDVTIQEPVVHHDATILSPFSATLGSILLDADYTQYDLGLETDDTLGQHHDFSQVQPTATLVTPLRTDGQIQLSVTEVGVFRNYVDNISRWVDSFSHDQPFHNQVPILALHCPPLMNSCLALASKQLELVGLNVSYGLPNNDSVRYYRLALNAIRSLLLHRDSAETDEVLASCIILSTYEMIDVSGDSLGSHLTGVASLLQARRVYGDVGDIRGSCYWTWYRHEVWAALRTGRRLSLDETYWQPPHLDTYHGLTPEDVGNRIIFIFGQCISFCNDNETKNCIDADQWLRLREEKACNLNQALDDWKSKLSPNMTSLKTSGATWFIFPQSAVANQVYHASKILLHLHQTRNAPMARGLANCSFLTLRRRIESHRKEIFLTANSGIPGAWSLVSSQCLYIAGLVTEETHDRERTLDLIDQCQRETGRRTNVLAEDLRKLWETEDIC
ncbi:Lysine biosynthesis regulatory LYS14 [Fusarium albosuccineum]|uniref:Lysine biosynthesis regulatory LYS14 n=1 Tax=Fusarium albosuccineum TaxID=1237068 RepID=A0A8H4L7Y2_9HYPO|nr:Lysine biosynthesis regulatory LYS14 [Fusarium albosuccineum]